MKRLEPYASSPAKPRSLQTDGVGSSPLSEFFSPLRGMVTLCANNAQTQSYSGLDLNRVVT